MIELPAGTKEYLLVNVKDRLGNLDTLDTLSPTFDVKTASGTAKYTGQTASHIGMIIQCFVDTTGWALDNYNLWVNIPVGIEAIKIGPMKFSVV